MESYNFTRLRRERSELGAVEGALTCGRMHTREVPLGAWPQSAGSWRVQGAGQGVMRPEETDAFRLRVGWGYQRLHSVRRPRSLAPVRTERMF